MDPRLALLLSALFTSAVVALSLAAVSWTRRATPGARAFAFTALSAAVWALGAAMQLTAHAVPAMLFWANVQFIGIVALPVSWTVMAFRYVGRDRWLDRRALTILCVIPALTTAIAWTEGDAGLVRQGVSLNPLDPIPVLHSAFGPWFWLHAGYSYFLLLAGVVALGSAALDAPETHRRAPLILIGGLALPLAWNAAYLVGLTPINDFDATPILTGMGATVIAWGLFREGLFGTAPIAYDRVVEALAEGVIILDSTGLIAGANFAAEELLETPLEKMLSRRLEAAFPTRPELADLFSRPVPPYRVVIFKRGEDTAYCAARIENLSGPRDRGNGHIIILRDFTQRKRLEDERERLLARVQQTAAEQQATLSSIPVGLLIYDYWGRVVQVNAHAERILGTNISSLSDFESDPNLTFETADGDRVLPEEMPCSLALRGRSVRDVVLFLGGDDGSRRCVSVSAEPILSGGGEIMGGVSTLVDITRLVTLQDERDDILRAISHDLRTPLTVVQGHAQILKLYGWQKSRRDADHSLEAIILASRQMNAMIGDLVDSLRMESGQLTLSRCEVDVLSIVLGIKDRMREAMDTDRVRVELPEELPLADADPDRVERIVVNLLTNALKYSEPDTEVVVRFSNHEGEVVVSVSDHGPGIATEALPRLFGKYGNSREHRGRRDSLGLGLYITKGLVEAHGGRIWAESEEDCGSIFNFTLPAFVDAPMEAVLPGPPPTHNSEL